jgi:DNA-binding transcriptional LysR family regulator
MAFDWDDLRVFVVAAELGSLTAAADALAINTATVGRRISRLESGMRATLFIRSRTGLQLTSAGARLLEAGIAAREAMEAAARTGEADTVGGTVRLSVAEGFGTRIVAPALPALRRSRPGLRLELAAAAGLLSPGTREVDLAVTLSAPISPKLVVEPLTEYRLGLYASAGYLDRVARPTRTADLAALDMVGYVEDLIYAPELRYLDEVHPGLRPSISSSSINAQREIVAAGGGIAILPCFLAGDLSRVLPEVSISRRFWISTHREVAATARIRAVRDWLNQLVEAKANLLIGADDAHRIGLD